jgi:hypothetical protein
MVESPHSEKRKQGWCLRAAGTQWGVVQLSAHCICTYCGIYSWPVPYLQIKHRSRPKEPNSLHYRTTTPGQQANYSHMTHRRFHEPRAWTDCLLLLVIISNTLIQFIYHKTERTLVFPLEKGKKEIDSLRLYAKPPPPLHAIHNKTKNQPCHEHLNVSVECRHTKAESIRQARTPIRRPPFPPPIRLSNVRRTGMRSRAIKHLCRGYNVVDNNDAVICPK